MPDNHNPNVTRGDLVAIITLAVLLHVMIFGGIIADAIL